MHSWTRPAPTKRSERYAQTSTDVEFMLEGRINFRETATTTNNADKYVKARQPDFFDFISILEQISRDIIGQLHFILAGTSWYMKQTNASTNWFRPQAD